MVKGAELNNFFWDLPLKKLLSCKQSDQKKSEEKLLLLRNPEASQTALWKKTTFYTFSERRFKKKKAELKFPLDLAAAGPNLDHSLLKFSH